MGCTAISSGSGDRHEFLRSRTLTSSGDLAGCMGTGLSGCPGLWRGKKAQNGTLSILIGGEDRVLKSCYTALAAMGEQILFVGPAGSGHAAKALNNYVSATGLLATIEALHVAQRLGSNQR